MISTSSGNVAFLAWFDALPVTDDLRPSDRPPTDSETYSAAKDDILPEAVERLRHVYHFGASTAGMTRALIGYVGQRDGYGAPAARLPVPEDPSFPGELSQFLRRIWVARSRIESGRDPFLGHYGRSGTTLEPVPAGRIARFDFRAVRLQLLGDDGWWHSLVHAPQLPAPTAAPPLDPGISDHAVTTVPPARAAPRGYGNQDDAIARQVLREKGFGREPDSSQDIWTISDAEAAQLPRIAQDEEHRLPPPEVRQRSPGEINETKQRRLRRALGRVTGRPLTADR